MEIYNKIKLLRENKKITQDYISYELGISQEAYSKLERGVSNITFKQVEIICDVLNISLIDLLKIDIDILTKKKVKKMYNIKEEMLKYHDRIINKNIVLEKWKPILQKNCKDEEKYELISNYCEKHSYYDAIISDNEDNTNKNLLPLCVKILSNVNCKFKQLEFDEFDLKETKEELFTYSMTFSELYNKSPNYGITMIQKMENIIVENIIEYIKSYIKENDVFIFQTPLIKNLHLENNNLDVIMKLTLNYCI